MSDTEAKIYSFPEFKERLIQRGALRVRDVVESSTDVDGLIYHHRGLQVPAEDATIVWEPDEETFRVEVATVGPRRVRARFDATRSWDVYLSRYEGGAVVAWMTDEEFDREEAGRFPGKAAAVRAGRFSFGTVLVFGPDWIEREEWAIESTAPGLLQFEDGTVMTPTDPEEFWKATPAIPPEFRDNDEEAPAYLGLVDCAVGTEIH